MSLAQCERTLRGLKQSFAAKTERFECPKDPLVFCKETLGFTPTAYQTTLIEQFKSSQFVAARWARQSGKSHTISALLLHYALSNPNTNIAIVGPSWRQTKLIIKCINGFLPKLPKTQYRKPQKTAVALTNGSNIEAYPNNPETIRGPKLHIVYCLPPDVKVALPDHTKVPICQLKKGQEVLSYNTSTRQLEAKKILGIFCNPKANRAVIRLTHLFGQLDCTAEHKVFTLDKGYVPASNLKKDDKILYLACVTSYNIGAANETALQVEADRKTGTADLRRSFRRFMHTKTQKRTEKCPFSNKPLVKTSRICSIQILNFRKSSKKPPQRSAEQGLGKTSNKIQHPITSRNYKDISSMLPKRAKNHNYRMARKNQYSVCFGHLVYGRWKSFKIRSPAQHPQIFSKRTDATATVVTNPLEYKLKYSKGRQGERILHTILGKRQGHLLRINQTSHPRLNAIQNLAQNRMYSLRYLWCPSYPKKSGRISKKENSVLKSGMQENLGKTQQRLETKATKAMHTLRKAIYTNTGKNRYMFSCLPKRMAASAKKDSKAKKQKTVTTTSLPAMRQSICPQKWPSESLHNEMPQREKKEILESSLTSKTLPLLRGNISASDCEAEILQRKMPGEKPLPVEEEQNEAVYDLEVEDNHNFFADGVLVSNCDEFNFIPNDEELYDAMLFTLGTTNGKFIATSTPWRNDSIFYKIFHDPTYGDYAKSHVTYQDALEPNGPLKHQILSRIRRQLEGDPSRWKREMEAEWAENENAWLSQALITQCIDHTLAYNTFGQEISGNFYAGLDLGKHQDPSVLAIVEVEQQKMRLIHLHRFPLETPYASVIGYVKTISDRWQIIHKTLVDQSGVGEYITEDMANTGLDSTEGITFTQESKQEMAQHLKQAMQEGRFLIPYDSELIAELNLERYELTKDGKTKLSHPVGTHDDRFWATTLAAYAARNQHAPKLWVVTKALRAKNSLKRLLTHRTGAGSQ